MQMHWRSPPVMFMLAVIAMAVMLAGVMGLNEVEETIASLTLETAAEPAIWPGGPLVKAGVSERADIQIGDVVIARASIEATDTHLRSALVATLDGLDVRNAVFASIMLGGPQPGPASVGAAGTLTIVSTTRGNQGTFTIFF